MTAREVELNRNLYKACTRIPPDYAAAESLLKDGADPLGFMDERMQDRLYSAILCESQENDSVDLPEVTALLLQYGMNIDHPRIPYAEDSSDHPMWSFAFLLNEHSICALKMLLDHGLSAEAAEHMWDHALFDLLNVYCGDPCEDAFWHDACTWLVKTIMLCASYDHVLSRNEALRKMINVQGNAFDLHRFRAWNDFDCRFDPSACKGQPQLNGSIVTLIDKATGTEAWKISFQ